jgi:hypothetical protein
VKVISLGVTVFPLLNHDEYSVHSWAVSSLLITLRIDSIVTCYEQGGEFGKITMVEFYYCMQMFCVRGVKIY